MSNLATTELKVAGETRKAEIARLTQLRTNLVDAQARAFAELPGQLATLDARIKALQDEQVEIATAIETLAKGPGP
jgi:transposase